VAANPVPLLDPCKAANGEEAGGSCDDLRCAHQRGRPEEGAMTCAAPLLPDAAMGKAAALGWPELGCMLHRGPRGGIHPSSQAVYVPGHRYQAPCQVPRRRHQAPRRELRAPGWLVKRAARLPFSLLVGRLHHKRCGTVVAYYESVSSNRFFCSYPMER
jgi:hypothetical protein